MENDFDDFMARFDALIHEAKEHGLNAVVALSEVNPLNNEETFRCGWQGGLSNGIGMYLRGADCLRDYARKDE